MPSRLCPQCGKPFKGASCPRCATKKSVSGSHSRSKRSKASESLRKAANPWRVEYGRAEYRRARQIAIGRTYGRCAACGTVCAEYVAGAWRVRKGGGVHHIKPLSAQGGNSPANLVLLCAPCHNRADALRRKGEK